LLTFEKGLYEKFISGWRASGNQFLLGAAQNEIRIFNSTDSKTNGR